MGVAADSFVANLTSCSGRIKMRLGASAMEALFV